MFVVPQNDLSNDPAPPGDDRWFREPTRREHTIAMGLFLGFGAFFVIWFGFQAGWWFRWVILALGLLSLYHGLRHGIDALRTKRP